MKKVLLIAVIALLSVLPATAATHLVNLEYGFRINTIEESTLQDIGGEYTYLGGSSRGFFASVGLGVIYLKRPSVGIQEPVGGFSMGVFSILGYGWDINWDRFGLILGVGGAIDGESWHKSTQVNAITLGIGGGARFYLHIGDGNMVLNMGLNGAWLPMYFMFQGGVDVGFFSFFHTHITGSAGIGWRL